MPTGNAMRAVAVAHPNVALVKYWGKRPGPGNLPATGSLSVTLGNLTTTTRVTFDTTRADDAVLLDGRPDQQATIRAGRCLDQLRQLAGVRAGALVESSNDFPTGSGLASSASGFAALVTAGAAALGLRLPPAQLAEIARHGSGSAARSIQGGFVLLTSNGDSTLSTQLASAADWPLQAVIAVTRLGAKMVGSTEGMVRSAQTSPYYAGWLQSHQLDLEGAVTALRERDFSTLANLSEHSCLKMHALMMSSRPPLIYWSPATLACIHRIGEMRAGGLPVFFTVDAGPQVKALCTPGVADEIAAQLAAIPGVLQIIRSGVGGAARVA